MAHQGIVTYLLLVVCTASFVAGDARGPLMDLFKSTGGPMWLNAAGWGSLESECTWFGVTCESGTVTTLQLNFNSLSGFLPESLGQLTNLTTIQMSNNPMLQGELPRSIGKLAKLKKMDLSFCRLTGPLPDTIGNLNGLEELRLQKNELQYALPDTMVGMTSLRFLWLQGNRFSAVLHKIYMLTNLVSLRLSNNEIKGKFPILGGVFVGMYMPWIGGFTKIEELHLDKNQFSGMIEADIGQLKNMMDFRADNNRLTGPLPKELGALGNLGFLDISNNGFTGVIHKDIANTLSALATYCSFSGNRFPCPLPDQLVQKQCMKSTECYGLFVGNS